MKISRVDLLVLALSLKQPFETSLARVATKHTVIVRALSSDGLVGYGEISVFDSPWYASETVTSVLHLLESFIVPSILGKQIENMEALQKLMGWIRGNPAARAGFEAACWQIWSMEANQPLWQMWKGEGRQIDVGISLGAQPSLTALTDAVQEAVGRGYRRVKLKIMPGRDVAIVARASEIVGNAASLSVNANGAYSPSTFASILELDEYGLVMIEQPYAPDMLLDHARLQSRLRTPICLDESITSVDRLRDAIELGAAKIICIKPAHLGGYEVAMEAASICRSADVHAWCGGMLETGVGKAMAVHLAATSGFSLPADISATDRYFVRDVLNEPIKVSPDGRIDAPNVPGLGWDVHEPSLDALTVDRRTLQA